MKIIIESTTKIVTLNLASQNGNPQASVQARIWEGKTKSGIPIHCYITRISIDRNEDKSEFERELLECKVPSPEIQAIPLKLIL